MFQFDEELKKLPDEPGVYIMRDKNDAIIYVGKALSLTKRVHQYFQASHNEGIKKARMVKNIARFEYIVTDSELEALVLECNLIKEHRPKYNTMLRDDKTYPYIKVTLGEEFPRVLFSRQMKKDKSKYFGPYTSAGAVKDSIDLLNKLYGLRTCSRVLPRDTKKERPCLNYHIKQCLAPCQAYISKEDYQKRVEQALRFLNGDYQAIMQELEEKMLAMSEQMEFEKAAEYRDLLGSVKKIAQKQKITDESDEDRDVIGAACDGEDAVVQVFFIRGGKLIGREHFYMKIASEDSMEQILTVFVKQYYAGTPFIPKLVMLPSAIEDKEIVEEWLTGRRGQKAYIKIPKKGMKEKLVDLAVRNAQMVLSQDREKIKREEGRTIGAMKEIAGLLGLKGISRVEAFDISNTSGFQSVGSMVVYEKGKPCRSDYRKFRLKTVSGPDDYASMREVLARRFSHGKSEREELLQKGLDNSYGKFTKFPDLIMMDGGKGQVNVALRVLEELHLNIPVCGMVKDDNHRTRGLYYHNAEIPIEKDSEGFKLITRIQDEAHRFAIEYHRSLRSHGQAHSVLDEIEGIGPSRRKALMKRYASLDDIRKAGIEELAETPSMNMQAAKAVYRKFHSIDEEKKL